MKALRQLLAWATAAREAAPVVDEAVEQLLLEPVRLAWLRGAWAAVPGPALALAQRPPLAASAGLRARALMLAAGALAELQLAEQALAPARRALALARDQAPELLAPARELLAAVLARLGHWEAAAGLAEQALAEAAQDARARAEALRMALQTQGLALAALQAAGLMDEAAVSAAWARDLIAPARRCLRDPAPGLPALTRLRLGLALGEAMRRDGQLDEAREHLLAAQHLAEALGSEQLRLEAALGLARQQACRGERSAALQAMMRLLQELPPAPQDLRLRPAVLAAARRCQARLLALGEAPAPELALLTADLVPLSQACEAAQAAQRAQALSALADLEAQGLALTAAEPLA